MRLSVSLAILVVAGTLCGCGEPAPKPAKVAPPVVQSPDVKLFVGEWGGPSQFLHLEADGTGYAANRGQLNQRVEVVMREDRPYWVIDFPDEETAFDGDRFNARSTSKRLTMHLVGDTIELSQGVGGEPRFRLKKRAEPRPELTVADFAGDWKVLSVAYDPKDPMPLDKLKGLLKLRVSLAKDGTGTGRYRTEPPQADAKLGVKNEETRYVLGGLHGKDWDMKLYFFGENGRLIQLREKGGGMKFALVPPDASELPF